MLKDKMVMTQLVTVEGRFLTGSVSIVPEVHILFSSHSLEWMARSLESYSDEVVREFYASYVVNFRGSLDRRVRPFKQDPPIEVLVLGCRVDISSTSINLFSYGVSIGAVRVP